jgi:cytosine/adenosine deaminase-related metal-dependent hydrolase
MKARRRLIHAAMVVDGESVCEAPGALLIDGEDDVIAAGSPRTIGEVADAETIELGQSVVMPAFVNAHAHLDLTRLGTWPRPASFLDWVRRVRADRPRDDEAIAESVRKGIALCREAGVAIVGDIAGALSKVPADVMVEMGIAGVSFIEVFGNGVKQKPALEHIAGLKGEMTAKRHRGIELEPPPVRVGIQPHAPYSCSGAVYAAAAESGLPMATHLAETPEEIEFAIAGTGDFKDLLNEVGVWNDSCTPAGEHPIDLVLDAVGDDRPFTAAHVNYVDDSHLERLARSKATVAFCPTASEYFGHPRAGYLAHRYREMVERGINVALGTDSVICQEQPGRLSILDEMRRLFARDGTAERELLRMGTVNGASALGFDRNLVTLRPGRKAGIIAVDVATTVDGPLRSALRSDSQPRWLMPAAWVLEGVLQR